MPKTEILAAFDWHHLKESDLRVTAKKFHELAVHVVGAIEDGPMRCMAIENLKLARDSALQAILTPGE